jgi:hypothetical protein
VDTAVAAGLALPDFEGFTGGFTIGLGYAGDGPFGDPQAFYGKATLVVGKKLDDRRDLGLVLDYDGNRSIMPDIPLPGFVYRHRIDKRLLLAAGVPITSVEWKPVDSVTLELIYALIDRFDVRATYDITRRVAIYGSFDQLREAFEMDELSRHDRLLYEQRRVEAGVRIRPMESTSLLVALGYAFSQEFGTGFDFSDTDPLAKPSDEPYLRLALETRF